MKIEIIQQNQRRLERLIKHKPAHLNKAEAFKLFNNPQYNIYSKLLEVGQEQYIHEYV